MLVVILDRTSGPHVRRNHGRTLRRREKAKNGGLLNTMGHGSKLEGNLGDLQTNMLDWHS
jgi:hypothetical protein